ncbi:urea carboxylase [Streptomyces sp. NPDC051776]|uniref:urea carboxylase n=1 Tax=Streptomyces sp. NPDC051776 TaxID=3155414 RepID=UPI003414C42B
MTDTVLVANRGEIACRVISSARVLGWRTVAVYSDADRSAPHVRMADQAFRIGPAPAAQSYLSPERILGALAASGADAVHPGYGFLSEDSRFAAAIEARGVSFVGPRPAHLEIFGDKNTARRAAEKAGIPVLPATGLLRDTPQALRAAGQLGYPLMVKAAGGGGGIGLRACSGPHELPAAIEYVAGPAQTGSGGGGVFLERLVPSARHIEVQVFGDGAGRVAALGSRDCSLQRRHQKVMEEAPAPGLPAPLRHRLQDWARRLCQAMDYRSAGTIEFLHDLDSDQTWFLEGNPRLQVEHPVTEMVTGLDLVALMLRLAGGEEDVLARPLPAERPVHAHAVEARVYAEDPSRDFLPSTGLLTLVELPTDVRVDGWVETGQEIGSDYDPLLAKIVAGGRDHREAFATLRGALERTRIEGVETNLGLLRQACTNEEVIEGPTRTTTLSRITDGRPRIEVERAGTLTTVQDWPGRIGFWSVGIPPSGPMDDLSFRRGNTILGNPEGAPGLECTWEGPVLHFTQATLVCVTGAPATVRIDGHPAAQWEPLLVKAGSRLEVGSATGTGVRTYVLFDGGLEVVPAYLGSTATFPLGGFGGHAGRALRGGDVLRPHPSPHSEPQPAGEADPVPEFTHEWDIAVCEGPHAAPDFLTPEGMEELYAGPWEVHAHSARSGVRLTGPTPHWSRVHGSQGGLHPSNIHDTPYPLGGVNFTGDIPIILGPDGPSLGGFVCPMTVVAAQRWKTGQMRPGDRVRFHPVTGETADRLRTAWSHRRALPVPRTRAVGSGDGAVLARDQAADDTEVVYRRGADDSILVEYGPPVLDFGLRLRVHALQERLASAGLRGLTDLTPGVRGLHLHTDPDVLPLRTLLDALREAEQLLPDTSQLTVDSREVHLPLSWNDPSIQDAISRYAATVRAESAWVPSNIDFIRRINGLDTVGDVRATVLAAQYLVLGLGDVYLGAPCATPVDPRQRLMATKYNPARTWTPEAAVGIGGIYLCVYGMESPGGYQLVGRTVPIWSGLRQPVSFESGTPWLLRVFDRLIWHPVSPEELLDLRADLQAGRTTLDIRAGTFDMAAHLRFLNEHAASITAARRQQKAAFDTERPQLEAEAAISYQEPAPPSSKDASIPSGDALITAPLTGSVWRIHARQGAVVSAGQPLLSLEAMKMEITIRAPAGGVVDRVMASPGQQVGAGTPLMALGGRERE